MGQITAPKDLASVEPGGFIKMASQLLKQVTDIIMGRLAFGENVQGQFIELTFEAPNVDKEIPHTLEYTPTGYFLVHAAQATILYGTPDSRWSGSRVFLKASASGAVKIFLY